MRVFIFILGLFILLFVLTVWAIDDAIGIGGVVFLFMGVLLMIMGTMGTMENCENETTIKEHNINPAIIEYIVDVRNQKDEMNISTSDAIAVYIECKRNGFTDKEIVVFLLPDITEDEARSIVKTYNLLEEEN